MQTVTTILLGGTVVFLVREHQFATIFYGSSGLKLGGFRTILGKILMWCFYRLRMRNPKSFLAICYAYLRWSQIIEDLLYTRSVVTFFPHPSFFPFKMYVYIYNLYYLCECYCSIQHRLILF